MRYGFWTFVASQWRTQPPVLKADLTEKTVVVIGANTGLGFEAAKHFATMNPGKLILGCRNKSKGEEALSKLKSQTSYSNAELWIIDLSNFESVKQFATKFEDEGGRLDILVMNAGMGNGVYESTTDGWEATIQVNDIATSLLSLLLLPRMIQTAKNYSTTPRLVVVSSATHYWADIEQKAIDSPNYLKTLGSQEYCTPTVMGKRYPLSKLLNVLFVRALYSRLPESSPTVITNAINPGFCHSELARNITGRRSIMIRLQKILLAFSTEVGSRQLVYGALAEDKDINGAYVSGSSVMEPSDFVISEEGKKLQDRVWNELVEILSEVDPRVQLVVKDYLKTPSA